jgi:endogenous inhibitor of DNA gyrase (YacG/DUF329 family)
MRHVRAVVQCSTCGRVSHGMPVELDDDTREISGEEATEVLRLAVQGLVRTQPDDLHCPTCGTPVFSACTKLRLVYEEGGTH